MKSQSDWRLRSNVESQGPVRQSVLDPASDGLPATPTTMDSATATTDTDRPPIITAIRMAPTMDRTSDKSSLVC